MASGRVVTASTPPWGFRAYLSKPHDGDSFWMMVDTGFGQRAEPELRLSGVHAPEVRPMQPGGQETADFVNQWLGRNWLATRRWPFWIEVEMATTYEPQMDMTFTRYVAVVWPFDAPRTFATSLNQQVITFLSGHPEWGSGD